MAQRVHHNAVLGGRETNMSQPVKIQVNEIASHRNGICGAPFHVVLFTFDHDGKTLNMVGVVFDAPGHVAVFDNNKLAEDVIAFTLNSWRGDNFEAPLRAAIQEFNS